MAVDDAKHRRSLRLKSYDYSTPGAYFVTTCAQDRECHFGMIVDGEMQLDVNGQVVRECRDDIPDHFQDVATGAFVIMPNHVHGSIMMHDNPRRGKACLAPTTRRFGAPPSSVLSSVVVVGAFKSAVSRKINSRRNAPGMTVRQRNYCEHVIRDEEDLARIREYIMYNHLQWSEDEYNPDRLQCA